MLSISSTKVHAVKMNFLLFVLVGALLGLFFFGGLWLTVRALPGLRNPRRVYWAGALVRFTVCLLAFFLILGRGPLSFAAACTGFYLVRMGLVPWIGQAWPGRGVGARPCR
jgi:F1F0 ATPase subunit 2